MHILIEKHIDEIVVVRGQTRLRPHGRLIDSNLKGVVVDRDEFPPHLSFSTKLHDGSALLAPIGVVHRIGRPGIDDTIVHLRRLMDMPGKHEIEGLQGRHIDHVRLLHGDDLLLSRLFKRVEILMGDKDVPLLRIEMAGVENREKDRRRSLHKQRVRERSQELRLQERKDVEIDRPLLVKESDFAQLRPHLPEAMDVRALQERRQKLENGAVVMIAGADDDVLDERADFRQEAVEDAHSDIVGIDILEDVAADQQHITALLRNDVSDSLEQDFLLVGEEIVSVHKLTKVKIG